MAAEKNRIDVVELLLRSGADVHAKDIVSSPFSLSDMSLFLYI